MKIMWHSSFWKFIMPGWFEHLFTGFIIWRGDVLCNLSGLREVSVAVEVKGERFHRAEDQQGAYRGLKVNKENHFVLIVSSMCAHQRMDAQATFCPTFIMFWCPVFLGRGIRMYSKQLVFWNQPLLGTKRSLLQDSWHLKIHKVKYTMIAYDSKSNG